jgi:hypothetical protein
MYMSKSILVMDTPKSCHDCCLFWSGYSDMCCQAMDNRTINYPYPREFRQDWCPLKQLPEVDEREHLLEWSRGYQAGWNDCINAIAGDKNDSI